MRPLQNLTKIVPAYDLRNKNNPNWRKMLLGVIDVNSAVIENAFETE